MKLKKIKNTLLVVLTLALVSVASVAITYAAVSADLGYKENTFTNEDLAVEISEQRWDGTPGTGETDESIATKDLGSELAKSYSANMVIPKNPMLTNISDTSAAQGSDPQEWVAIKATYTVKVKVDSVETTYTYKTGTRFEQAIATLCTGTKESPTQGLGIGWTANTDKTVFYYNTAIANKVSTTRLFDFVKINNLQPEASGTYQGKYKILVTTDAGVDEEVYADELPEFHIKLEGYAVQYDGTNLNTAAKAKTPLDALMGV